MKNYYEILEVNENASNEIIEKAYKILIKKYHPDLYSGEEKILAERKVRDLNEAYKILSDIFLRTQYDNELNNERNMKYNSTLKNVQNSNKNYANNEKIGNKVLKENQNQETNQDYQIGTMKSMVGLVKEIFKVRPKKIDLKNMNRTDLKALVLTVGIVIVLGIILWFIPFTNGFVRSITVDNPMFSWIGKIFGK